MRSFLFFLAAAALCGVCRADSITIQGTRHVGVYVIDADGYYQVYGMDGRKITSASKRRMDVSDVLINRDDPNRIQFLRQMNEKTEKDTAENATESVPVKTAVLHGDPAVAAASLAAHDAAMAAETARRAEEQRQRAVQDAVDRQRRTLQALTAGAAAQSTAVSSSTRQNDYLLKDAAAAARRNAEAQEETARAIREQTTALERHTLELRNLRESQRFHHR